MNEVFHVELRQFPHTARAFNLSEEELHGRLLERWRSGAEVTWAEREWSPRKARITVLRGPRLDPSDLSMGRGWQQAERTAENVTEALLSRPRGDSDEPVAALKHELLRLAAAGPLSPAQAVVLMEGRAPGLLASARLAVAEQAVWELLHEGRLELVAGEPQAPLEAADWRERLLSWRMWAGGAGDDVLLRAPLEPG